MGVLAYNILHMLRQFFLVGEEGKRSMKWIIKRLIKVGGGMSMLRRRFLWLDITVQCSGEDTRSQSMLTVGQRKRYAQTQENVPRIRQQRENSGRWAIFIHVARPIGELKSTRDRYFGVKRLEYLQSRNNSRLLVLVHYREGGRFIVRSRRLMQGSPAGSGSF
jgi:hypothetical protein